MTFFPLACCGYFCSPRFPGQPTRPPLLQPPASAGQGQRGRPHAGCYEGAGQQVRVPWGAKYTREHEM